MAKSPEEQIQMMVEGAQPQCDEPLRAAMICGHSGSMAGLVRSTILRQGGPGGLARTSDLPNPVLIAVGPTTVYAFKYTPKGFKVKLKKRSEVARWPRDRIRVERGEAKLVSQFSLIVDDTDCYDLEVTTLKSGQAALDLFLDALVN